MKKGQNMNLILLLLLIVALGYFLIMSSQLNNEGLGTDHFIGKNQVHILELSSEAELSMLSLDKIADYILPTSLFRTGVSGALLNASCGRSSNYNLWFNKTSECIPVPAETMNLHLSELMSMYIEGMKYFFSVREENDTLIMNAVPAKPTQFSKGDVNYYMRQSFRSEMIYDLDLYDLLFRKSSDMRNECMNKLDYQACMFERFVHMEEEMPNLKWMNDCNKGAERVFYHFIDEYERCLSTFDDECVCEFSMDLNGDFGQSGDYTILLSKDGIASMGDYEHKLDINPSRLGLSPETIMDFEHVAIKIQYDEDGLFEGMMLDAGQDSYTTDKIIVHKNYIEDPHINTLKYGFVIDSGYRKECATYPRTAKICVEGGSDHIVYGKEGALRSPIPIKFGVYFNDIFPPSPVEEIKVQNKEDDEEAVWVSFKASEEEDLYKYNIYMSKSNYNNINAKTPFVSILKDELADIPRIMVEVEDNEELFFAVTAVDVFGNENSDVETVVGMSYDNLEPAPANLISSQSFSLAQEESVVIQWMKPFSNINGKPLVDLEGYIIFFNGIVTIQASTRKEAEAYCMKSSECAFASKDVTSFTTRLPAGQYNIKVVAIDEAANYAEKEEGRDLAINQFIASLYNSAGRGGRFYEVRKSEGGWVADPADPGGETFKGITMKYWSQWSGWDIVVSKRESMFPGRSPFSLTKSEATELNRVLKSMSEIEPHVLAFYESYWNMLGLNQLRNYPMQKLLFNFGFNTPKGAFGAAASAVNLQSSPTSVDAQLAASLNSLTDSEDFAFKYASYMYDYYSKGTEKFRRGWYIRLLRGVNQYLAETGSAKEVIIVNGVVSWK